MTKEILESDVYKELDSIQNKSLLYPDYYLNPFHAYDEGNLTWLVAVEAEAATKSMVRRAIPTASSVDEATQILRGNWLNAIEQHHLQHSQTSTIDDILDIGCSVGVSSRYLAEKFPSVSHHCTSPPSSPSDPIQLDWSMGLTRFLSKATNRTLSLFRQFPPSVQPVNLSSSTFLHLFKNRANPAKRREIEDNSKRLGGLFAKLNSGDISKNASDKLLQLRQALDNGDFGIALQIPVLLTTTEWDECQSWLYVSVSL